MCHPRPPAFGEGAVQHVLKIQFVRCLGDMASEGEAFSNGDESIDEDELLEALEQEEDEWDGAVAAPAPASDVARPKQSFESLGLYSHKSS